MKPTYLVKEVTLNVLEGRLARAIRPKERLWATIQLAKGLLGKDATQTEQAFTLFTEAERLAEDIHDRRGAAAAIHGTGYCQFSLSNFSAALESFARALPITEQTGYAECEVMILRDMGQVYIRQSRQNLALETFQKCAEVAELIGNTRLQASALDLMGTLLKNLGQYQEAVVYHTKSLALFERNGAATVGRAIQNAPGWTRDQAMTLLSLGTALRYLGRYGEALSALDRATQLCQAGSRDEGLCQGSIGVIYSEIGDYPNALSSLFASAKIMECIGDKLNLANTYINLMGVYLQLSNLEGAKFGEKALAVFEEIGDKRGQAAMFVNLGEYYLDRGEKVQAKRFLNRGLSLSREIGSKNYETSALTVLAKLEMGLGNIRASEKLFQRALSIATTSGDQDHTVAVLLGLGSLFHKQGEPNQALPFLDRAVTVAMEIHARHREQEAHQMLAEAFEAVGDLKRALTHSKLASSIKEEILGIEKQKTISELQIRSDIEKLEIEKALLRKETAIKSQDIEKIAMALAEKTETIRNIRRRIGKIVKSRDKKKYAEFSSLLSDLDNSNNNQEVIFNDEFQHVHQKILRKLSKRYPTLTLAERKICVLLREGMTIKEMALMLKISNRTIEWHRYQIRNKMNLPLRTRLTTVLAGIV